MKAEELHQHELNSAGSNEIDPGSIKSPRSALFGERVTSAFQKRQRLQKINSATTTVKKDKEKSKDDRPAQAESAPGMLQPSSGDDGAFIQLRHSGRRGSISKKKDESDSKKDESPRTPKQGEPTAPKEEMDVMNVKPHHVVIFHEANAEHMRVSGPKPEPDGRTQNGSEETRKKRQNMKKASSLSKLATNVREIARKYTRKIEEQEKEKQMRKESKQRLEHERSASSVNFGSPPKARSLCERVVVCRFSSSSLS